MAEHAPPQKAQRSTHQANVTSSRHKPPEYGTYAATLDFSQNADLRNVQAFARNRPIIQEGQRVQQAAAPGYPGLAALQAKINEGPAVPRLHGSQQAAGESLLNLQPKRVMTPNAGALAAFQHEPADVVESSNHRGLPRDLRTVMEHFSSISLDDVQVHRNSGAPARLGAHAYAQGRAIHLAPGQERHLPHEAWHVVQQAQGRVRPTLKAAGMAINDDPRLEVEADRMGTAAQRMTLPNAGHAAGQPSMTGADSARGKAAQKKYIPLNKNMNNSLGASNTVQRVLSGDGGFSKISIDEFKILFEGELVGLSNIRIIRIFTQLRESKDIFTIDGVRDYLRGIQPTSSRAAGDVEGKGPAGVRLGEDVKGKGPEEARGGGDVEGKGPAGVRPGEDVKGKGPEEVRVAVGAKGKGPAKSAPGAKIIVNNVWLGDGPLGPLERFNIYTWRALGHSVRIYTLRFDGRRASHESLGIDERDAEVKDLGEQLDLDEGVRDAESPKFILKDARDILRVWGGVASGGVASGGGASGGAASGGGASSSAASGGVAPTREQIYNMVDLAKSYLGATQRGIVLDMKVGPSEHLLDYVGSFHEKFISYSRGSTSNVENQSMGTMQESEDLRKMYAVVFSRFIATNEPETLKTKPGEKWFDLLTGGHGRAFLFGLKRRGLDVSKQDPAGRPLGGSDYPVAEPREPGRGPFRVFKAASDQTNKSGGATQPDDARQLAELVMGMLREEPGGEEEFLEKASRLLEVWKAPKKS